MSEDSTSQSSCVNEHKWLTKQPSSRTLSSAHVLHSKYKQSECNVSKFQ